MTSDVYQVKFYKNNDVATKQYKVRLKNGEKKNESET